MVNEVTNKRAVLNNLLRQVIFVLGGQVVTEHVVDLVASVLEDRFLFSPRYCQNTYTSVTNVSEEDVPVVWLNPRVHHSRTRNDRITVVVVLLVAQFTLNFQLQMANQPILLVDGFLVQLEVRGFTVSVEYLLVVIDCPASAFNVGQ
ncbi:hypothetical protein D3C71_1575690 [compost metagenome]